ncbi:MAG: DNA polymerase/3'-5' exonuclease PolX [Planctomycetaceae bacterium]
MSNAEVAAHFEELADLLEIQGANAFRIRAYRSAARTIESLSASATELALQEGKVGLQKLDGIGADLADKIVTLAHTGELPQLNELREAIPQGVRDMLRLPGIGPKKVAALSKELAVQSFDDLKLAAEKGQIAQLKGFGKKTEQMILEGIAQLAESQGRFLLPDAKSAAEAILAGLLKVEGVTQAAIAGSCRRRQETCGDLDILATSTSSAAAMDFLATHPLVTQVLARGETKQRVRLTNGIELDLRVVPEESYGAAMQYFTGSKEHNIVIRRRAQERGLKLNEYGLYRGDEIVAGRNEADIYAAVDLPWIPPELRENRGEIEAAARGEVPKLVTIEEIQGDLHMHTTATDGTASIREMAEAARDRGLKYIAITDHSQRVSMAHGLDAPRLRAHWDEIEKVRHEVPDIQILKGIECDILEDARMDLSDDLLAEADWVIAVLHYGLKQPREQIMQRLLMAVRHPSVDIIGHPSGRIVGRRPGADIDYPTLFQAARDEGVMMEINAHPSRVDLDDIQAASAAKDYGIPIVISTDAHSTNGFDVLPHGLYQARRAGLEAKHIANTLPFELFKRYLRNTQ